MNRNEHRPIHRRAADSVRGLAEGIRRERAVRTHLLLSAGAIIILAWIRPPVAWTLAVLVLIVVGLAAESLNGALEAMLDRLHPDENVEIGVAKDMASAAPFVIGCATAAAFVGAVVSSF
ncbi:MAG: diacylglycerol kinase [Sphingomicrobium sp.]